MTLHMPGAEALERLRDDSPDGPIMMLNLLKYREPGGREAFGRYGKITAPLLANAGGQVVFAGVAGPVLTGSDVAWDDVAIVRFPSALHFLGMVESETYTGQAAPLRAEALEATLWMAVNPHAPFAGSGE